MRISLTLSAIVVLTLAACDSGEEEPARIFGTYSGTANVSLAGDSEEIPLVHMFVIREDADGFVDGELTVSIDGTPFEYEVSGTVSNGSFDLDIEGSSSGLDYRGTVNADATTLQGVMDWPAGTLNDYSLTVRSSGGASVQIATESPVVDGSKLKSILSRL